ncbi:MAG: dienelactone hydrolase family protein [Gammaproteobacteria bacterium]
MNEVLVEGNGIQLPGLYKLPEKTSGLVIFAHGSGSSRLSPRNQFVADYLNKRGIATLLFDLLTEDESQDRRNVFDIGLLAERLTMASEWVRKQPVFKGLPIGYFGASTGAAAALVAAADPGQQISAVVSRGGRPDLAIPRLKKVTAPTLLLVGGLDHQVIVLNKQAATHLHHCEIIIVPGATHLFEEPGTLEQVCDHAADWFAKYLVAGKVSDH